MEPIKFWEFMSLILEGLGYERPSIKIPVSIMMPIACLVEQTYKTFSRFGMRVPQLTPSRVRLLSCNRTFSSTKAKDHIGYEPIVSLKDGLKKTIESYSSLRADQIPQRKSISKAASYLGNGKLANILLWKDKKQTVTSLLLLVAIYYYVFTSGYTFITSMAKLLSMFSLFLFIHGTLPSKIFKYRIEKLPPSYFQLTEDKALKLANLLSNSWNSAIAILISLCKGKEWSLFFKVVCFLLALNILGALDLRTTYKIGVFVAFFMFSIYEKWEDSIDSVVGDASSRISKLKSNVSRRILGH